MLGTRVDWSAAAIFRERPTSHRLKLAGSLPIDRVRLLCETHRRRFPESEIGILMFWRFIPSSNVMAEDTIKFILTLVIVVVYTNDDDLSNAYR